MRHRPVGVWGLEAEEENGAVRSPSWRCSWCLPAPGCGWGAEGRQWQIKQAP